MPSWQPPGQASPQYGDPEAEQEMGKKIQYIGRYVMDARTLGKGNFARVELATHGVTQIKVIILMKGPKGRKQTSKQHEHPGTERHKNQQK